MDTTANAFDLAFDLETRMAGLLGRRYGDGTIYLAPGSRRDLIDIAIERGFLSEEGFLTRKGRALVARLGR